LRVIQRIPEKMRETGVLSHVLFPANIIDSSCKVSSHFNFPRSKFSGVAVFQRMRPENMDCGSNPYS